MSHCWLCKYTSISMSLCNLTEKLQQQQILWNYWKYVDLDKSESQMGFEPTTLHDLVGCSNHWATGDSVVSKPHRAATQPRTGSYDLTNSIALSHSPLSHGGHFVPGDQESFVLPRRASKSKPWGARLNVVKQSFFGLPGQYGRRVTKAN